ncbi:unnamed protein product, partial [marine sediment metagenome]
HPDGAAYAKPSLKSNSTVTDGTEQLVTWRWSIKSQQWDTNPADDEAWEWADIDDLQIGVSLRGDLGCICTQVYVEVDYTYEPPTPPVTPEYQRRVLMQKQPDDSYKEVSADYPLEVHDPKVGSLISYEGTTTADGEGDGSTLVDSVLETKSDFNGNLVIITSGAYEGQARDINGGTTGGTVTPASAFGDKIVSGVTFVIVGIRTVPAEVAAIEAALAAHEASQATHRTALGTHETAQLASRGEVTSIETKVDDLDADLVAVKTETALIKTQTDK